MPTLLRGSSKPSAARRRVALVVAAVLVAAGATDRATAQEPPRGPTAAETLTSDAHRVRGILAWRKAVWSSDIPTYQRAARELDLARSMAPGAADPTVLFLLGFSRARSGDPAGAAEPLREGRRLAPGFPAHLLTEAVAQTGPEPGYRLQDGTRAAIATLDRYLVEIATYPPKSAFAAELRYLGLLERGLRLAAIDEHDRAIRDFDAARAIVRAEGRTPSTELSVMLCQSHESLSQFALAETFIAESLHRDPGEPVHYHNLALVAADGNRRDEARAWNQRAVARRLDYVAPRAKLAYLAWETGDLDAMRRQLEACEHLQMAEIAARPSPRDAGIHANLHSGWGTYWLARGDRAADGGDAAGARVHWERARTEFLQAEKENPGCIRTLVRMVEVLSRLHAPEEQIDACRQRLDDIRNKKAGSPPAYRDTFC